MLVFRKAKRKGLVLRSVVDKNGHSVKRWMDEEKPTEVGKKAVVHQSAMQELGITPSSSRAERNKAFNEAWTRIGEALFSMNEGDERTLFGTKVKRDPDITGTTTRSFSVGGSSFTSRDALASHILLSAIRRDPKSTETTAESVGTFSDMWISPRGDIHVVWGSTHEEVASDLEKHLGLKQGTINNYPGEWVRIRGNKLDEPPLNGMTQRQINACMDILVSMKDSAKTSSLADFRHNLLLNSLNGALAKKASEPDLQKAKACRHVFKKAIHKERLHRKIITDSRGHRTTRWVKMEIDLPKIKVSTDKYEAAVKERMESLFDSAMDAYNKKEARRASGELSLSNTVAAVSDLFGPEDPDVKAFASGGSAKNLSLRALKVYRDSEYENSDSIAVVKLLSDYSETDPPDAKRYAKWADSLVKRTNINALRMSRLVRNALKGVPEWSSGEVTLRTELPYDHGFKDVSLERPASTFTVRVGSKLLAPEFTVFLNSRTKIQVDDVLDAGDSDFFTSDAQQGDYFDLVQNLQDPDGSKRKGVLTLYTARPTSDRHLYEGAEEIPSNIFLANDASHVEGLSKDLAGTEQGRDIYRIRIDRKHLNQTLDGRVKYYQAIGRGGKIPIRSIERIHTVD